MSMPRLAVPVFALLMVAACGGGSSNATPTAPSGPQTASFSGTASTTDAGGCSSAGHTITAGSGTLTIVVGQASASRIKLQVCAPTAVDHANECTIPPFASLAVGESISRTLKGGRTQAITVYPDACGSSGNPPASTVTYTIAVTYPGG